MKMRHCSLLLPFAFALSLCGVAACDTPTEPSEDLPITRITQGTFSRFETSQRMVVTSQAQLLQVWAAVFGGPTALPPELPAVDFSREVVIVAAAGTRSSGDLTITVESANATSEEAVVTVRTLTPGANCVILPVVTNPYDVVRIPARQSITFVERTGVRPCN
jgi:PrcB C-terminal